MPKMLKRIFTLPLSIAIMSLSANAETVIPAGDVSGVWRMAGSPYMINGDITIPSGETLTIYPGVTVFFESWYKLTVNGRLMAVGSEGDSIHFTATPPGPGEPGWLGIRFINAEEGSRLQYSIIDNAKATAGDPYDRGAGIYIYNSNPVISNSTIKNNQAKYRGAGIYIEASNPSIRDNLIADNLVGYFASGYGGAIYALNSQPEILNNVITGNRIVASNGYIGNGHGAGGAIYLNGSDAVIARNLIAGNSVTASGNTGTTSKGGALALRSSDPQIINNTFYDNPTIIFSSPVEGGAINLYYSSPVIKNNIIAGNSGSGIHFENSSGAAVSYNDFSGYGVNFSGSSFPGGLGYVSTVNGNGDPSDVYYNIFLEPMFNSPVSGDFSLQSVSPAIDAGDPGSARDPDSTFADLGAFYFHQGGLTLTLTPHNPPIMIPALGGSFAFTAELSNISGNVQYFDLWTEVEASGGSAYGPILLRMNLSLQPGGAISRDIIQTVPGRVPAGNYIYAAKVGTYPDNVVSNDYFNFTKSYGNVGEYPVAGWNASGWDEESSGSMVESAADYQTFTAYPNPFNPETVISFELRDAGYTKLAVYDVNGREVASLAQGLLQAGAHRFDWNASSAPSGVYFARLNANGLDLTKKLLLVK